MDMPLEHGLLDLGGTVEGPCCTMVGVCKDCGERTALLQTRICLTCYGNYDGVHKASRTLREEEPPVSISAVCLHEAARSAPKYRRAGFKKEVSGEDVLGHTLFIRFLALIGLAYFFVWWW